MRTKDKRVRLGGIAFLALASCLASEPTPAPVTYGQAYTPSVDGPALASPAAPVSAAQAYTPPAPAARRVVPVRVLGARWRGQLPSDESGPWSLGEAELIVDNLNTSGRETGLTFVLESATSLDVADERLSSIPTTRQAATAAMDSFVASGRVSNQMLTVVVVGASRTSWVSGWGQQGHPLRTPGKWPIILVNTRIAKSREAHWMGHELGHVFGFYDTTFYDASPVDNPPYTQCGLRIQSRTYPKNVAPLGARQNVMSYQTEERRTYFSAGYETTHRQILDCWIRSSGL